MKTRFLNLLSLFILFVFCVFSYQLFSQTEQKANEARQIWLKGFDIYEKAELNEKLGKYAEALDGYEKSLTYFQAVKSKYPDWNTYLIDFRIQKCVQQITALRAILKTAEDKKVPQDKEPSSPSQMDVKIYETRIKTLQSELVDTRAKLDATLASLSAVKKEAAQGVSAMEELRRINQEKVALEKRYQLMSEQLEKALRKNQEMDKTEKMSLDNKQFNTLKKEFDELTAKYKAAEEKLKETEEEKEVLKRENQSLKMAKTEFDFKSKQYENTIAEANKKINEDAKIAETLRENINARNDEIKNLKKQNEKLIVSVSELKKQNEELNNKLSQALNDKEADSLLKKLQQENGKLLEEIESQKQKIDELAKIAEQQFKTASELSVKNEKLEKLLFDATKKAETSTADLSALKKKHNENLELLESQKRDIVKLTQEKNELENTVLKLSEKLNQMSKKDADYTELTRYAAAVDAKNREFQKEILSMTEQVKNLSEKLALSEKEIGTLNDTINKYQKTSENINTKKEEIELQSQELKRSLDTAKRELELAKSEANKFKEQNALLKSENEEYKKLTEGNTEIIKANKEYQSQIEKLKKELERSAKNQEELSKEFDKTKNELKKREDENKELIKNSKSIKNQLDESFDENKSLQKKIDKLNAELENIKKSAPDSAKIANLQSEKSEMEKTINALKTELSKVKELNQNLMSRLEEKVAETVYPKHFQEEKQKLQNEVKEKEAIIKELKKKIAETDKSHQASKLKRVNEQEQNKIVKTNDKAQMLLDEARKAEKNNTLDVAIWHYQKVFEFDSDNQNAAIALARIFAEKGENDKALSYLGAVSPEKISSSNDALQAAKTCIKISPENSNKAKLLYKKALELGSKPDPELETALEK